MTTETVEEATLRLARRIRDRDEDHMDDSAEEDLLSSLPFPNFTQDQAVEFLTITAESSWDIPSALGAICQHHGWGMSADMGDFPMHGRHPSKDFTDWPQLNDLFQAENSAWDVLEPHFREVHHIDLTDSRINWQFDT